MVIEPTKNQVSQLLLHFSFITVLLFNFTFGILFSLINIDDDFNFSIIFYKCLDFFN